MRSKKELIKGVIPRKKKSNILFYIYILIAIFVILGEFYIAFSAIEYRIQKKEANIYKSIKVNKENIVKKIDKLSKVLDAKIESAMLTVNAMQKLSKKPSYEYMKSVTVILFKVIKGDETKIARGTGIILLKNKKFYYILTNKHVCGKVDVDSCFLLNDNKVISLEFIKQHEEGQDLALWKVREELKGKQVIRGIASAKSQDKVYSVGNYLELSYVYSEGTFAGYSSSSILLNLPIAYGCSGSGIFDSNGKLIGLVYASPLIDKIQIDTSKAIGINSKAIKQFVKELL